MTVENHILAYLNGHGEASVRDMQEQMGVSRQLIHRVLNKLQDEGVVQKLGKSPKVFYRLNRAPAGIKPITLSLSDDDRGFLKENFLLITELGKRLEGAEAMQAWCERQKLPIEKTAREFIATKKNTSSIFYHQVSLTDLKN